MHYSDSESRRFQLQVYRDHIEDIHLKEIIQEIESKNIDLAILRIPAEKQYQIAALEQGNLPYIIADTLVYYTVDLTKYTVDPLRNTDLIFAECKLADQRVIGERVDEIFPGYTNHYYSNPHLNKENILEGYKEWASGYIAEENPSRISWIVKRGDDFVGFATCSFDATESEGVLYGVRPRFSGGGIYGDFIRFTQNYFQKKQIPAMKVSTQVQNYAVQKVWSREGFYLNKAYITIHINAFLRKKPVRNDSFQ